MINDLNTYIDANPERAIGLVISFLLCVYILRSMMADHQGRLALGLLIAPLMLVLVIGAGVVFLLSLVTLP